MRLLFIIGTRPEAIKLAPVVKAADSAGHEVEVWFTGQHATLATEAFGEFGIELRSGAVRSMHGGGDTLDRLASNMMSYMFTAMKFEPDYVVVQGDTISALMGALSAFHHGIPVAHVEAGLRTEDLKSPFPEEAYRQMIARISAVNFAPTLGAAASLCVEWCAGRTYVVGNTVVDAVRLIAKLGAGRDRAARQADVLVTCHRRENHGRIDDIKLAVAALAARFTGRKFLVTAHPNPKVRESLWPGMDIAANVRVVEPMAYSETIRVMSGCELVMTDSGGLQEECSALGVPLLVLRDTTERMEVVDAGGAVLMGDGMLSDTAESIRQVAEGMLSDPALLKKMSEAACPYGDGEAAEAIIRTLLKTHNHDRTGKV